ASNAVELGWSVDGWVQAVRIEAPAITVAGDPDLLVAGIASWCAPVVETLAPERRGRVPLWGQVADAVGNGTLMLARSAPGADPVRWISATERLLACPSAPWRTAPQLWTAPFEARQLVVCRRGSCCLYYRHDEPTEQSVIEPDPDYLARFGHE